MCACPHWAGTLTLTHVRVAVVAGLRAVLAGPAVLAVAEEVALHVETAGAVLAGVGAAGVHVDLHNGQASPSSSSLISIPHLPPSSSSLISIPHLPPSSSSLISIPHLHPSSSSLISIPHLHPSSSSLIFIPHLHPQRPALLCLLLVSSCLVLSRLAWFCLVLPGFVSSCLVLSRLVCSTDRFSWYRFLSRFR